MPSQPRLLGDYSCYDSDPVPSILWYVPCRFGLDDLTVSLYQVDFDGATAYAYRVSVYHKEDGSSPGIEMHELGMFISKYLPQCRIL